MDDNSQEFPEDFKKIVRFSKIWLATNDYYKICKSNNRTPIETRHLRGTELTNVFSRTNDFICCSYKQILSQVSPAFLKLVLLFSGRQIYDTTDAYISAYHYDKNKFYQEIMKYLEYISDLTNEAPEINHYYIEPCKPSNCRKITDVINLFYRNGTRKQFDKDYQDYLCWCTRFAKIVENNAIAPDFIEENAYRVDTSTIPNDIVKDFESIDFIVKSNLFSCQTNHHEVYAIIGKVPILGKNGRIFETLIPASYCLQCNCFSITEHSYELLNDLGFIQCKVIDEKRFHLIRDNKSDSDKYAHAESILKQHGYNVISTIGLCDEEREDILKSIIEDKSLSPSIIVSYLEAFIAQKKGLYNYQAAVSKWRHDCAFVEKYKNEEKTIVNINSIKLL